jgi:hypothetical protein
MKGNKLDKIVLYCTLIVTLCSLPFLVLRKPPIKDWLIVYLFNAATNGVIDIFLTTFKIVRYPVRFFPKIFSANLLFDYLVYPSLTILYNQMTEKDKPIAIFYKLLYFTVPMFFIEYWAVRKTNLIKWNKGWKWYHTFISVTIKSLLTRCVIGIVRIVEQKQKDHF